MNANVKISKAAVAGGVNDLGTLLRRREEIGEQLDSLSATFGAVYRDLAQVQKEIGIILFQAGNTGGTMPQFLADATTAYRLRNRLGVACAPHSSGGGKESPFGIVQCSIPLAEIFKKDSASLAGKG